MIRERTFRKIHHILFTLSLLLTLLGIFCLFPLYQYSNNLSVQIQQDKNQLLQLNHTNPYQIGITWENIQTNINNVEPQIKRLRSRYQNLFKTLELPPETYKRVSAPFQTFDYIMARNETIQNLTAQAAQANVALAQNVLNIIPEYHYGITNQHTLWVKMTACQRVIQALIQAKPTTIQDIQLFDTRIYDYNTSTNTNSTPIHFYEYPFLIKITAPIQAIDTLLKDFRGIAPATNTISITNIITITNFPPPITNATEQPATEQPATEQPAAEQPAAEQPAAEQPAAEQPAAEQPAAEQPAAEQPAAEQPAAEQPAAEAAAEPAPAPEPEIITKEEITQETTITELKNSIYLGPFQLYISPDDRNQVTLEAIISIIYSNLAAIENQKKNAADITTTTNTNTINTNNIPAAQ